ncbi:MAG: sarcosine oxidase subunit gamma [Rhodobacteraceae bacterium]|nr:MAG: sarcosine oxidase subunit gamma [Paracoccaceae bacterium]
MHDLSPLTALGAAAPRSDTIGPVTLREEPDRALASVAARTDQATVCQAALARFLGVAAPGIAQHVSGADLSAFWIGPASWMIEAPNDRHPDLAGKAKAALGDAASVTDQSGAWVRLDMTGDRVVQVMERLCNLDMGIMPPGKARRTVIDHLGCYVIRHAQGVTIYGPRSGAKSLHHAVITAMHSAL